MRLTVDVILRAQITTNPLKERELNLRGYKAPAIENLGVTKDGFDCIDLSDNEIKKLENFPRLRRLQMLLVNNNQIGKIQENIADSIESLEYLILTGNRITQLSEINHLVMCKKLDTLSLIGNPVVKCRFYRQYVIHKLPQLRVLDFQKIRPHERQAAASFFLTVAGKRIEHEIEAETNGEELPPTSISPPLNTTNFQSTHATQPPVPPSSQKQTPLLPPANTAVKVLQSVEVAPKAIQASPKLSTSKKRVVALSTDSGDKDMEVGSPPPSKKSKSITATAKLTTPTKDPSIEEVPYTPSKPIEQLTVNQLREALKERGLSTKGLKAELLMRLKEAVGSK